MPFEDDRRRIMRHLRGTGQTLEAGVRPEPPRHQMVIRAPTSTARSSGMQNWSDTSLAERAIGMKM